MKDKLKLRLTDHLPYNKTRSQVEDCSCFVEIKDYDGSGTNPKPWVEITLQEVYTPSGSTRQMSRTILATLDAEQRAALLAYLLVDQK